ncbi:MAG: hypothetical protein ABIL39_10340 [candidate division WOR-3 bacterium]
MKVLRVGIILLFLILFAQENNEPEIYRIGEWVRCGDFEFKVNDFSLFTIKDNEIWREVSGEDLSDEEFLRREGKNRKHSYVVVDLSVRGTSSEPQIFDFLTGVSLYSTSGATCFIEGAYDYEIIWKILNRDKSYEASVTKYTSARRKLPFPAGSSGIYRLDLEGTIGGKASAFIELGYEPENEPEEENLEDEIDWNYWAPAEFKRWKKLDDIAVRINKVYLDSLIDPIPPQDPPGKETRRYYLIVDISFRSLKGTKTIYPSGDFCIKGSNRERPMFVADYEGRDVEGNIKLGMYEKLNPGRLRYSPDPYSPPYDEVTITPARETVVSRKIPFAVGENYPYGMGRRIVPYLTGAIFLCYGHGSIPITNLDWQEKYYE